MYSIGYAKDIHKLKATKGTCILGGYKFKSNYKVVAVSDGDLVLHAIANAILGACQAGDIGMAFPDTNPKNKGLDSKVILTYALAVAKSKHLKIMNIDLMIVCDKIMINPIRKQITKSLCGLLNTNKVNVKATRYEQNASFVECDVVVLMKGK